MTAKAKGKKIARTPTRVLHVQRDVGGRTYQHDIVARWDHATKEYVTTPEQRSEVDEHIAAKIANEPPSGAGFAFIRLALALTPDALAHMLQVSVDMIGAWERNEARIPHLAWLVVGSMVLERARVEPNTTTRARRLLPS